MARRREIQSLQEYAESLEATVFERNREVQRLTAELAVESCHSHDLKQRLAQLEQALLAKSGALRTPPVTSCMECRIQ